MRIVIPSERRESRDLSRGVVILPAPCEASRSERRESRDLSRGVVILPAPCEASRSERRESRDLSRGVVILPAPCEASRSERRESKVRLVHPGGTREGSVAGDLSSLPMLAQRRLLSPPAPRTGR